MPEKINEKIFKDETEPLEKKPSADFEFSKTSETEKLVSYIDTLADVINHDGVVRNEDLKKIENNLGEIKVDFGGELFTIEELKSIPDIKENVNIWEEVMDGNFENTKKLTYITLRIGECLSKLQGYLNLSGITSITDTIAERLSKHRGSLVLTGLTTISDASAEHLSKHKGLLDLSGLTTVSDTATDHLSKIQGTLIFIGLTSISDTIAKHLSKHQGRLYLNGLTSISDTSAKYLSKHKNLNVNNEISEIIDKFKQ